MLSDGIADLLPGLVGSRAMIEEGLLERFPCDAIYAQHNWPELPLGSVVTRPGPIMAAAARFDIVVRARTGHAAQPHRTPDVMVAASQLVCQLNTVVPRRVPPADSAVLSVTGICGGQSHSVLPAAVETTRTVRSFDEHVQDTVEALVRDIACGVVHASGAAVEVDYVRYCPATVSTEREANLALAAARTAGLHASLGPAPAFTSEDFAVMLREKPGAYVRLGQGRSTTALDAPLHDPTYDFNDGALLPGVAWFAPVAELELRPGRSD